ncbi:MAG: SprB repeat-containing protein [Chitinophagales bacterium]
MPLQPVQLRRRDGLAGLLRAGFAVANLLQFRLSGTVANVACFGNASGGINISVAGGTAPYAFAWSNGSSLKDLANVPAGNYSLTAMDATH